MLRGHTPELPWQDKIVIEVEHPAWYKVSAVNLGARALLEQGYEYIAWLDAASNSSPVICPYPLSFNQYEK